MEDSVSGLDYLGVIAWLNYFFEVDIDVLNPQVQPFHQAFNCASSAFLSYPSRLSPHMALGTSSKSRVVQYRAKLADGFTLSIFLFLSIRNWLLYRSFYWQEIFCDYHFISNGNHLLLCLWWHGLVKSLLISQSCLAISMWGCWTHIKLQYAQCH